MIGQAAGFAVLAAISPTALIVMAVFLGSSNPRLTALAYVTGAFVMTVVMALVVLYVLRSTGLNLQTRHDPRYEFRLGLGLLAMAGAAIFTWAKRPKPAPSKPRQGLMARLVSMPSARTAFAAGVLVFAPSATFIAAVQVVATSQAGVPVTALTLVIIILVTCMVVWVPLLTYLAAPEATTRWLKAINDWIRAHAKRLGIVALALCGVILVVNGALGVAGVI
jgi:Sap, sulfolipid-1-addressing protein